MYFEGGSAEEDQGREMQQKKEEGKGKESKKQKEKSGKDDGNEDEEESDYSDIEDESKKRGEPMPPKSFLTKAWEGKLVGGNDQVLSLWISSVYEKMG